MDKTNFTYYFQFYNSPKLDLTEQEAILLLSKWIDNSKYSPLDIINYPQLIYLEKKFENNEQIQKIIISLKDIIYHNYEFEQTFIYKIN